MEASNAASRAGGRIFDSLLRFIVTGATAGCLTDTADIEAKARLLPGSSPARRAQIANIIHDRCIANTRVTSRQDLADALARLRRRFVHAGGSPDLLRLHGALLRFTHCNSFFMVCRPTIQVTLATLIAYVLVGELMQAVDMVDAVERVVFRKNRPMASELADLLELKYGLINLAQYKLIPGLLEEAGCCEDVVRAGAPAGAAEDMAEMEAERLLEMPVRSGALSRLCDFLVQRGTPTSHAQSEYMAGLKIEELPADAPVAEHAVEEQNSALAKLSAVMDSAARYERGAVLDGAVTSPLGAVGQSPFDGVTLQRFVLLEYLHIMKLLANCISQRSSGEKIRIAVNTCPFKTTTAAPTPAPAPDAEDPEAQVRAYQKRLQSLPITGTKTTPFG
ncbi:ORF044 virion core protein [Bovine papular stomatitis virus]|uniref:Assembly protein G7 n=1 Tax=Bovine papular stomatitis virus TaxID=129727 RepID=Q6TVE4_9POXV|nr:putative virion core protein [Bovine papular stomatitis virus]AAR98401.1 ORF044 virion core protein [Bovine papular stomatitis virus]